MPRCWLSSINSIIWNLETTSFPVATQVTCLGVVFDCELTFSKHVTSAVRRCFYHLRQIRAVRKSLTTESVKTLVHALIASRLDYCNGVFHQLSAANLQALQPVLNAGARLIMRKQKYDHITSTLRDDLHWLPIRQRILYKLSTIVYKCIHRAAPSDEFMCPNRYQYKSWLFLLSNTWKPAVA